MGRDWAKGWRIQRRPRRYWKIGGGKKGVQNRRHEGDVMCSESVSETGTKSLCGTMTRKSSVIGSNKEMMRRMAAGFSRKYRPTRHMLVGGISGIVLKLRKF